MQPRLSFVALATFITAGIVGCTTPAPSIIGKWSGQMIVECPHPLPPSYRPLPISLDIMADGQCTTIHGSGIGADITSHGNYQLLDSLFLFTGFWGTDTLKVATFTETELVLRRGEENGCVHSFVMTREAHPSKTP